MQVQLDTKYMRDREKAHAYLQEQLHFPEYYGGNLDALYDCLTEMDEAEVKIIHRSQAGAYCKRILQVFMAASRINGGLMVRIKD
ncbi:MAG: barstar family protein [Lachnospiraceae bacterium]|nr:barstar family protein [Lachnospiraceae bacterium]